MEKNKKKINWRRTLENNLYMLGLIMKACPGMLIVSVAEAVFSALNAFMSQTYLYQYALNALQEGKQIREIIVTLCWMTACAVFSIVFARFCWCYNRVKLNEVEAYIQNLLQKKAVEVDLACFEQPDFYDTYVKACNVAGGRANKVLDNVCDILWCVVYLGVTSTVLVTIDPVFVFLALAPLACQLIAGRYRNRVSFEYKMKKEEVERQKDYVRRTFYLNDFSKEMRLTEMWRVLFRRMHDNVAEMKALVQKYGVTLMWFRCAFECVTEIVVTIGAITLAAFKTLVARTMPVGNCFVVINSMELLAMNFNYIGKAVLALEENSPYIENLRGFLGYETVIREEQDAPEAPSLRTLELRKVSFSYGETRNITDDDREKVRDALKRSGIYDRVESLPREVDTMVTKEFDSEGAAFSGGEAQKVSIARIFAGDHEVVIMDEPTSALDPIAEQEMYRNMFEACAGKTVIFISHRLSTTRMADRIYMFDQGRVVEAGSHDELMELGGKYAEMYRVQAKKYQIG